MPDNRQRLIDAAIALRDARIRRAPPADLEPLITALSLAATIYANDGIAYPDDKAKPAPIPLELVP